MRRFDYEDENEDFMESEAEFFYNPTNSEFMDHGIFFSPEFGNPNDKYIKLLQEAISICERSFFWKFKSLKKKIEEIVVAYEVLKKLFEEDTKEL